MLRKFVKIILVEAPIIAVGFLIYRGFLSAGVALTPPDHAELVPIIIAIGGLIMFSAAADSYLKPSS